MQAVQYQRSVPRYLVTRAIGGRLPPRPGSRVSPVQLVDIDPPRLPTPRWARVRPILSGICGSDLATATAQGSTYFSPFTSTPFVFGHEVVGEVVETGPEADRVRVGDRVVLAPPLHCAVRGIEDRCPPCRSGEVGHCLNVTRGDIGPGIQTGYCRDTGGGWSGSLVAHPLQLHPVPAGMDDAAAVLVEPYGCCLHAVERAELGGAETVLVLGCGTIGLLTIAALRASGATGRIVAAAKYPHQARRATELGADLVVGAGDGARYAIAEAVGAELHHPELGPPVAVGGAEATFDCVGSADTLDDALRLTAPRGRVVVVGMPGVPRGVDWTALWHKELDVRGSYTCRDETFVRGLEHVASDPERFAPLVGARFALSDVRAALDCAMNAGRAGVVKVVFEP